MGQYIEAYFQMSVRLTPKTRRLIKNALPYRSCKWGLCKKPASKWVEHYNNHKLQGNYKGKFCKTHAMWQCSDWNLFDKGIGLSLKEMVAKHKTCSRCSTTR